MKMNLTKKEYETLLDVLYIADWVIRAHEEQELPETEKYKELEQKIYALAKEFGLDKAVDVNPETKACFLTKEHMQDSLAVPLIEKFENATFWEELLERLARRDFIRQYGEEAIINMSLNERFEKELAILQQYDKEFGDHGLENIHVTGVTAIQPVQTKKTVN